ncbi:hypothetical protein WT21_12005 [Burkholderia territorii]|nr:DUF3300 domain-containing protein [Burkholderia territorii]KVL25565.1 hypothetical protein WS97_30175 [Burkholderia territorii]KVQ50246.1 hypothetical protein WT21_12005 [Burkholderia territorii]KVT77110.1 hypothetical protein WT25_23490 [Burkholderia territorii]
MLACSATLVLAPAERAHAQTQAKLSSQQLDALTAPVALYPDALLAQVLMAATFPDQVNAAAAWQKAHSGLTGDNAVKAAASEPWDPSVQSLVAFPQVLAMMASKPDWTAKLGNAFLAQPNDVMDSAQRLRRAAQQAGHLQSNSQQKVIVEQSTIQIQPANPQVVYVPTYNPTVVYGTWPYPAYPPVYVPPPPGYAAVNGLVAGIAFGTGVAITNALWGGFDWNHHDVNINVNRYNNINVNHRIDATTNVTHWNRSTSTVDRRTSIDRTSHDAYRGRDESRARAEQTLQTRTGQHVTGSAADRVGAIRKDDAHERGHASTWRDNSDVRARAQSVNRDGALRDAGDGDAARRDMQRGQASRQAASMRASGLETSRTETTSTRTSLRERDGGLRTEGGRFGRHR